MRHLVFSFVLLLAVVASYNVALAQSDSVLRGLVDPTASTRQPLTEVPDSTTGVDSLLEAQTQPEVTPLESPRSISPLSTDERTSVTDQLGRTEERIPLDQLRFADGPTIPADGLDSLKFTSAKPFYLGKARMDWDGYWISFQLTPAKYSSKEYILLAYGPNLNIDRAYVRDIKTKELFKLNSLGHKRMEGQLAYNLSLPDRTVEVLIHTYDQNLALSLIQQATYPNWYDEQFGGLMRLILLVGSLLVGFAFTAMVTMLIRPTWTTAVFAFSVLLVAVWLAFNNHVSEYPRWAHNLASQHTLSQVLQLLALSLSTWAVSGMLYPHMADVLKLKEDTRHIYVRLKRVRLATYIVATLALVVAAIQLLVAESDVVLRIVPQPIWQLVLLTLVLLCAIGCWWQAGINIRHNISLSIGSLQNVQTAMQLMVMACILSLAWHIVQLTTVDFTFEAIYNWVSVGGSAIVYLAVGLLLTLAIINRIFFESVDTYLAHFLPKHLRQQVIRNGGTPPSRPVKKNNVSVMFTDIKGFSKSSLDNAATPDVLAKLLDAYFKEFDDICQRFGVERIKTIGDSYMAAGGLTGNPKSGAFAAIRAGLKMQEVMQQLAAKHGTRWELRVGINSGPVAEYIMDHVRWNYDLWGPTVNTAKDTEGKCPVGAVTITESTYELVNKRFTCEFLAETPMKSGQPLKLYRVLGENSGRSVEEEEEAEAAAAPKRKVQVKPKAKSAPAAAAKRR